MIMTDGDLLNAIFREAMDRASSAEVTTGMVRLRATDLLAPSLSALEPVEHWAQKLDLQQVAVPVADGWQLVWERDPPDLPGDASRFSLQFKTEL